MITALNGTEIKTSDVLRNTIAMIKPGTMVALEVVTKASAKKLVKAKLGQLPETKPRTRR